MDIVAATGNPGKLAELRRLLADRARVLGLDEVVSLESPEETGATFAENAILKALHASGATDLPVIADDSGLCVDHLGGRPGVRSARYGGPGLGDRERCDLLLAEMSGVPDMLRGAHYAAAVALACSGRLVSLHEGACGGLLTTAPRGDAGFGYDPIFLVPKLGRTMAEISPEEKDAISHRARALAGLRAALGGGVLG